MQESVRRIIEAEESRMGEKAGVPSLGRARHWGSQISRGECQDGLCQPLLLCPQGLSS